MPNYFQLVSKNAPETKVIFADVDDSMREFFGEEPDKKKWLYGWYDILGWGFCMGDQPMEIASKLKSYELKRVCEYLDRRFTISAWSGRGR